MSAALPLLDKLAARVILGDALHMIHDRFGPYELLDHWLQGEFHHDLVLKIPGAGGELPGEYLVIATNCNGGIKEVLCVQEAPERWALWHHRCPDNPEFCGEMPEVLARAVTEHWFNPCMLLVDDARSEIKASHRRRQRGGGWRMRHDPED